MQLHSYTLAEIPLEPADVPTWLARRTLKVNEEQRQRRAKKKRKTKKSEDPGQLQLFKIQDIP